MKGLVELLAQLSQTWDDLRHLTTKGLSSTGGASLWRRRSCEFQERYVLFGLLVANVTLIQVIWSLLGAVEGV